MDVTSLQDFKFLGKQISQLFSCELRNSPRNGTKGASIIRNKKMVEKSVFREN